MHLNHPGGGRGAMRWALLSAAAVLAIAGPPLRGAPGELRVAVLDFTQAGPKGEFDSLGKGLQAMVTTDLNQVKAVQLVERARLKDIQAELKLGQSGQVDARTAARLGKLIGASHILAGTYTIVGGNMRIDSLLFSVEGGKILFTEKIEGERDAFFELEKELVNKLIKAVRVDLAPKERASVAHIHTADFEAFRKFSLGVQLFDEKKYEQALSAIHEAENRDKDFKLAALTLAEYDRVIGQLSLRAENLEAAQLQVRLQEERLKQDKDNQNFTQIVDKLFAIAAQKDPSAQIDRLVALHSLVEILTFPGSAAGWQDGFAMSRTADVLRKNYLAEASQVFPRLPLIPTRAAPKFEMNKPEEFDAQFGQVKVWLLDRSHKDPRCNVCTTCGSERCCAQDGLGTLPCDLEDLQRSLHVDTRGWIEVWHRLLQSAQKQALPSQEKLDLQWRWNLAMMYREVGDIAKSSSTLISIGATEKNIDVLREVAAQLKFNKSVQQTLEKSPLKSVLKELLTRDLFDDAVLTLGSADKLTPALIRALFERRADFPQWQVHGPPVLIGDTPVWRVSVLTTAGEGSIVTGPRSDPLRADELRYYSEKTAEYKWQDGALMVTDGSPRQDVTVRFDINYEPAADWGTKVKYLDRLASDATFSRSRPEVGFAFGVRNIHVHVPRDRNDRFMNRSADAWTPRSWQVLVNEEGLRLMETTHEYVVIENKEYVVPKFTIKAEQRLDLRATNKVELGIAIEGNLLRATLNGRTYTFPAPSDRTGFYGLTFHGPGYAAIRRLKVAGKAP